MKTQQGFYWLRAAISTIFFLCVLALLIHYFFPRIQYTQRERDLLACRNEKPISKMPFRKIIPLKTLKNGLVTFWFDNAWQSQYVIAAPILKQYNYKAVVAVATARVCRKQAMTWAELRKLQKLGWGVSSMGENFSCDLSTLSANDIEKQLRSSKMTLREHGLYSPTFTVPCGFNLYVNPAFEKYVPKYYVAAIQAQPQLNFPRYLKTYRTYAYTISNATPLSKISRWLQLAKQDNGWIILRFNRINNTKHFSKIVHLVHQADVQVVLPRQLGLS